MDWSGVGFAADVAAAVFPVQVAVEPLPPPVAHEVHFWLVVELLGFIPGDAVDVAVLDVVDEVAAAFFFWPGALAELPLELDALACTVACVEAWAVVDT